MLDSTPSLGGELPLDSTPLSATTPALESADLRVVVVDDHPSFRSMASRLLKGSGFSVVGEAADAAGAVRAVEALRPDLVLLDIQLPDIDGFAVADTLAGRTAPPTVVLMSSRARADYGSKVCRTLRWSGSSRKPTSAGRRCAGCWPDPRHRSRRAGRHR